MTALLNDLKGDFGQAYVRAVAHAAGFFVEEASRARDSDGVDLTVVERTGRRGPTSRQLDVQLKTTASIEEVDPFPWDLEIKNYDELRAEDYQVPRILVVVHVPTEREQWVQATPEALLLRHCGYWASLRGQPASTNRTSVRVFVPRVQYFHVDDLRAIMQRIRETGRP